MNKFISKRFKQGVVDQALWEKDWVSPGLAYGVEGVYSLEDQIKLSIHSDPRFYNKKYIQDNGFNIKKGAKSFSVEGNYFNKTVYNASEIEGMMPYEKINIDTKIKLNASEDFVKNFCDLQSYKISHDLELNEQNSEQDNVIVLPEKEQFLSHEKYYSTLFHEIADALIKKNNDQLKESSTGYKKSVVEATAFLISHSLQVSHNPSDLNIAYIQGWKSNSNTEIGNIFQDATQVYKLALNSGLEKPRQTVADSFNEKLECKKLIKEYEKTSEEYFEYKKNRKENLEIVKDLFKSDPTILLRSLGFDSKKVGNSIRLKENSGLCINNGLFFDHKTGKGGDVFKMISYLGGDLNFKETLEIAASVYGVNLDQPPTKFDKDKFAKISEERKIKEKEESKESREFFKRTVLKYKEERRAEIIVSSYLDKKGLSGEKVPVFQGKITIPYWKEGEIIGLQQISDEGKFFVKGSRFKGGTAPCFIAKDKKDKVVLTEGWADALSIGKSMGYTSYCAGSVNNLEASLREVNRRHPNASIYIAADHDGLWLDSQGRQDNIGLTKSFEALKAFKKDHKDTKVAVVTPVKDLKAHVKKDFNDLYREGGENSIKVRFEEAEKFITKGKTYERKRGE